MATALPPLTPSPLAAPPSILATSSPPFTIIITFVILIFFFVVFFSIYFSRCFFENLLSTSFLHHNPHVPSPVDPVKPAPGLDPEIVQSFPTFDYSSVKGYRREKYGLECAICLVEFDDTNVLRLLTPCCHVFHQVCIDLWLESHKTCPVCRKELDLMESSVEPCTLVHDTQDEDDDNSFVITIKDDRLEDATSSGKIVRQKSGGSEEKSRFEKFSKSHSTGHSIVTGNRSNKKDGDDHDQDRYTLRLPDHVKSHIIKAHHSATKSCTQFGDL